MRDAILRAADHLERHPEAFNFMEGHIPTSTEPGQQGCYLAWIAHFAGVKDWNGRGSFDLRKVGLHGLAYKMGFVSNFPGQGGDFGQALRAITKHAYGRDYGRDSAGAPAALRKFADERYPAEAAPEVAKLKVMLQKTRAPSWWPPSWFRTRESAPTTEHNTVG
jgi:hypothetical protein